MRQQQIATTPAIPRNFSSASLTAQRVGWAADSVASLVEDVGVDHGGADAPVFQDVLDDTDVVSPSERVGDERSILGTSGRSGERAVDLAKEPPVQQRTSGR